MVAIARATLVSLVVLHAVPAVDVTSQAAAPTVRIVESGVDLHAGGITASHCIVVRGDGSFHLERRFQRLPAREATLHIYEATFNAFEMDRLEQILDGSDLRDLSEFRLPQFPMNISTFATFQAKIVRGQKVQSIGYFAWNRQPGTADGSPENTPDGVKKGWEVSRAAMSPMASWLHEMEGRTWPEVDQSRSNLCEDAALDR